MISKIEIKRDVFVYVVQIAGLVARRIKCELEENQSVNIGDRFGILGLEAGLTCMFQKVLKSIH